MVDRWLFALFFVVGFATIFLLKQRGVDPTLVAGLTVGTMVVYGVLAYRLSDVRLRPDRLGDNIYYMGFVFTLASMSSALVDLQHGAEVSTLIGSFGIALFSTIAGIAGRVLLLQMRTEVEDVEELVRKDLLEHADRLRGQLSAAVGDLEVFRLGVRQAMGHQLEESLQAHDRAVRQQLGAVQSFTDKVLSDLEAWRSANGATLAEMRRSGEQSVEALREVWKRFSQIRPPSDILDRKLDGAMRRINAVVEAFETTAGAEAARYQALASVAEDLHVTVAALRGELQRMQGLSAAVGTAGTPASQLAQGLSALRDQVEGVSASFDAQRRTVDASAEAARRQHELMEEAASRTRGDVVAIRTALDEAGEAVARGARSTAEQLSIAAAALASQREAIDVLAQDAARARQQIDEELAASRAAVMELEKATSAVTGATKPVAVDGAG